MSVSGRGLCWLGGGVVEGWLCGHEVVSLLSSGRQLFWESKKWTLRSYQLNKILKMKHSIPIFIVSRYGGLFISNYLVPAQPYSYPS